MVPHRDGIGVCDGNAKVRRTPFGLSPSKYVFYLSANHAVRKDAHKLHSGICAKVEHPITVPEETVLTILGKALSVGRASDPSYFSNRRFTEHDAKELLRRKLASRAEQEGCRQND
jgi:hypothetical protein